VSTQPLLSPVPESASPLKPDITWHSSRTARARKVIAPAYRKRDYYMRRLLALGDISAVALALALSLVITNARTPIEHVLFGVLTLPVWLFIFKCYGLYERDFRRIAHSTIDEIPSIFHAILLGTVLSWMYFQATPGAGVEFVALLLFASLTLGLVFAARAISRAIYAHALSPERVLLVATGLETNMLTDGLEKDPHCRVDLVGRLVACDDELKPANGSLPVLGLLNTDELRDILIEQGVDRVVLATNEIEQRLLVETIRVCTSMVVKVSVLPAAFTVLGSSVEVDDVRGVTVFGISPAVLPGSSRLAKRALDLIGGFVALILFAPLLLTFIVLVKLDSNGPVFFRQRRVGQDGKVFDIFKFRTMVDGADAMRSSLAELNETEGLFKIADDPRITRVGRFLRRTSLDELPQLFNVLRGEMSLVGPRPLVVYEDEQIDGWHRERLALTPGMTGRWQILGSARVPLSEMVKLDYLYVTNWSLWNDVKILLRTVPFVLGRRGL
jgi:exopolysaccharide biosynthesis polyprenyl glycosylphosphotransferase